MTLEEAYIKVAEAEASALLLAREHIVTVKQTTIASLNQVLAVLPGTPGPISVAKQIISDLRAATVTWVEELDAHLDRVNETIALFPIADPIPDDVVPEGEDLTSSDADRDDEEPGQ